MKRVITITMDIDESNYFAQITTNIKEDGKPKKEWTMPQGISTALILVEQARRLLYDMNEYSIDTLLKNKEEQK